MTAVPEGRTYGAPGPGALPPCDEVWVEGNRLVDGYIGCSTPEWEAVAGAGFECGYHVTVHGDFWTRRDGVIRAGIGQVIEYNADQRAWKCKAD